jgi:hypothetical protein
MRYPNNLTLKTEPLKRWLKAGRERVGDQALTQINFSDMFMITKHSNLIITNQIWNQKAIIQSEVDMTQHRKRANERFTFEAPKNIFPSFPGEPFVSIPISKAGLFQFYAFIQWSKAIAKRSEDEASILK